MVETRTSPIDLPVLDELCQQVGREVCNRLIDTFLTEFPKGLQQLRDGCAQSQHVAVKKTAHRLKSNSAYYGANTISQLCKQLEAINVAGFEKDASASLLAAIEHEWLLVNDWLQMKLSAE